MEEENLQQLQHDLSNRGNVTIAFEAGFTSIIIITAFFGNFIVLVVLCKSPRLRSVTNMFLIALSVTDLLTTVFGMPFTASIFIRGKWIFDQHLCVFQGMFVLCLVWMSLHVVALMAVNRYFCVIRPSLYRKWFTKKLTCAMIAAISLVPFLLTVSPYLSGLVDYIFRPGKAACFMTFAPDKPVVEMVYILFLLLLYTILPMVTIVVCYYKVFRMIKRHAIAAKHTIRSHHRGDLSSEELRMTKMLFVLVISFVICWFPVIVVDVLSAVLGTGSLPREAYVAYILFAFFSSCINPIVCLTLNGKIRREAKRTFLCQRWRQVADVEQTLDTVPEPLSGRHAARWISVKGISGGTLATNQTFVK